MIPTFSPADRLRELAAELLQREHWSRDQLESHQRERVRDLLAHAAERSPYYGEALGSGDLAAQPRGLFVYNRREWAVALARTGARPGERTVGIGAPPGVHMSERIYAALQAGAAPPRLSALTPLDEIVAALNAFQPQVLLGYPTVAALLAAEQLAGRLSIAPRLIAFGSEPLTAEMRGRIAEAWGIDPGEYYSTTEAATIASSTPEHPCALEIFEDQYVIEIVEDLRADGAARHGPIVLVVAVLPLRIGAPFAGLPAVRQYQIVHRADRLEVRLVLVPGSSEGVAEQARAAVVGALHDAGAVPPPVTVTMVAELERESGPAAKLKLILAE